MFDEVCAVPYRITDKGVEVLLITSRRTKEWIFPKGQVMGQEQGAQLAIVEAWEEGGVKGIVDTNRLTVYQRNRRNQRVIGEVYLLRVNQVLKKWPESSERKRCWIPFKNATGFLSQDYLLQLIPTLEVVFRQIMDQTSRSGAHRPPQYT